MPKLKDFLGMWKYSHSSADKYWSIVPIADNHYCVTWGNTELKATYGNHGFRYIVIDTPDAISRIRAKARGGYKLIIPYIGVLNSESEIEVEDFFSNMRPIPTDKAFRPKKPKFDFSAWLMEEEK
jgi:hypothetical protein